MPPQNKRGINDVLNIKGIAYGVLRSDPTKAMPINMDDNGLIYVSGSFCELCMLQENGDAILMEDGDNILVEA